MSSTLKDSSGIMSGECSFVSVLEKRARQRPDGIAYSFTAHGETEVANLCYRELSSKVRSIASYLQSKTVIGDRVLLLFPPGLDFVSAFLGCLYAGVVAVPAYLPRRNQRLSRLQFIVEDADASALLSTQTCLSHLKQNLDLNSPLLNMQWVATDAIDAALKDNWQPPNLCDDTLAFLQYTSGSTGSPKGVMISHGNLMHNSEIIRTCFGHTSMSRGVIWLPPYHDMGLIGGVLQPLYSGFPVILMSAVDFLQKPIRWLKAISHAKATTSGGPNFAYDLCLKRLKPNQLDNLDLSSWEVAFTGAEPIQAETLDAFAHTFEPYGFRREAFYPCYGMAEATLIISGGKKSEAPNIKQISKSSLIQNRTVSCDSEDGEAKQTIVGCGRAPINQVVEIVEPDTLTSCQQNQIGEIWVAGPSVAKGYWKNPQETNAAFKNYLYADQKKPFLRTGDLGFIERGELYITGRIKDLIIIRGQNYYPQDIERTIENSHPALSRSSGAAFSIEVDGVEQLVVVSEIERTYLRKLDVKNVSSCVRQAITANHDLRAHDIVLVKPGSIPKTSSGKIRRQACKMAFLTNELAAVGDMNNSFQVKPQSTSLSTGGHPNSQMLSDTSG